jgi:predicted RND superfamily exporter protein
VPVYVGQGMNHFLYGNDAMGSGEGTAAYEDEQVINAQFGRSNTIMIIFPNTSIVKEKQLSDELADFSYTKSVTSLAKVLPEGVPESILPGSITKELHTDQYARMMVYIRTENESELAFQCCDEIKSIVKKYYPDDYYLIGATPAAQDIKSSITGDRGRVNMASLLGVALVVMISFQSILVPILVLIPIELAIFINMSVPYLMGSNMVFIGYLIVSNLQLGATVDYSILMTNNYLDRRLDMDKKQAVIEAISVSAPSILTSGLILSGVGYILKFTCSNTTISDMGDLVGRGTLLSMVMVLFLLPALLTLFDKPIIRHQQKQKMRLQRLHDMKSGKVPLNWSEFQQRFFEPLKNFLKKSFRSQNNQKK